MNWYNVQQASEITGKSIRTVRWYLQKWKEANLTKNKEQSMYRYHINDAGTKILQVSALFLQACFNVDLQGMQKPLQKPLQDRVETPLQSIETTPKEISETQSEKWEQRERELRGYYEAQLNEIKDAKRETIEAKQQTIDNLERQVQSLDVKLNKVLEQYQLAQITISNLLPSGDEPQSMEIRQTPEAEEIQEITEEQQSGKKLSTTKEYMKKKGFTDWLKSMDGE